MDMRDRLGIVLGKAISFISRLMNLGAGATWPGEIALRLNPRMLSSLSSQLKKGIILVAGTNGKTTAAFMIKTILEAQGFRIVHNASGANLLNGVVSACINASSWSGTLLADYGVFEVDENSLPWVVSSVRYQVSSQKKMILVLLNLFRDQLDRYGEVDVIAEKWQKSLKSLENPKLDTGNQYIKLVLNADDSLIAHLGITGSLPVTYFGGNDKTKYLSKMEHATDSTSCLNCGGRLAYEGVYYSHIGIWYCTKCKEKRPTPNVTGWKSPLPGLYNEYNTLAAVSVAKELNIKDKDIQASLATFRPAFGRQEEFIICGKKVKIFLSKNPAGFNQSLKTVLALGATQLFFVLNDRIPDGRDVSWIWDVDFEVLANMYHELIRIVISGDRCWDMALRVKYADLAQNVLIEPNLESAIKVAIEGINVGETLYVLPTYSAMLEVRKLLSGRKIL